MVRVSLTRLGALAIVGLAACAAAEASNLTLDSLFAPDANIRSGDKVFFGFGAYDSNGSRPVEANTIFVEPYQDFISHEYGLRFSSASFFVLSGDYLAAQFQYRVLPGDPNMLVSDGTLKMTAGQLGVGRVEIVESVFAQSGTPQLARLLDFVDANGGVFYSHQDLGPAPAALVLTRISLDGGPAGSGGVASVSDFNEAFSQVPEPSALAALSLGLFALRRRRACRRRV